MKNIVKKTLAAFIAAVTIALPIFTTACDGDGKSLSRVSRLREDVLYGKGDYFELYLYPEMRETPEQDDGYVGKMKEYLVFKLVVAGGTTMKESPTVKFAHGDKEYSGTFEFKPVTTFLFCTMECEDFKESEIDVTLGMDSNVYDVRLASVKKDGVAPYAQAIDKLTSIQDDTVKKFVSSPESYELRVRLTETEGFNYWIISLVGADDKTSYLFDAVTLEPLAVKQNK